MGKIVDMTELRQQHELKRKDERTEEMRNAFRQAREGVATPQQSTEKLLKIFKKKPVPHGKKPPRR